MAWEEMGTRLCDFMDSLTKPREPRRVSDNIDISISHYVDEWPLTSSKCVARASFQGGFAGSSLVCSSFVAPGAAARCGDADGDPFEAEGLRA